MAHIYLISTFFAVNIMKPNSATIELTDIILAFGDNSNKTISAQGPLTFSALVERSKTSEYMDLELRMSRQLLFPRSKIDGQFELLRQHEGKVLLSKLHLLMKPV